MSAQPAYLQPAGVGPPLGPYSHLSRVGDLGFVAGQVGLDAEGELAGSDLAAQARQAFANIRAIVESQGADLRSVLKFTTYLVGVENIERFYAVRAAVFPELYPEGEYPPNTLLVVDRLVRPEFLVEIEAVAHLGDASAA
jgi:enamine deaminase RidA (YjgF/YER057c/UK114 family)